MSSLVSQSQVGISQFYGGNYGTLTDFVNKRTWSQRTFVNSQVVAFSAAKVALLDSTMIPSGVIALGLTTTKTDGTNVAAASATFTVGTAGTVSTSHFTTADGVIGNLVVVRDSTTQNFLYTSGNQIFGLIQSATGVVDGDSIGASGGTENLRLSLVYFNSGVLTVVPSNISQTLTFNVNTVLDQKFSGTTAFDQLVTLLNKKQWSVKSFVTSQVTGALVGAGAVLIDNTMLPNGLIALSSKTLTTNGGIAAAHATFTAGTAAASLAAFTTDDGAVGNLVNIRNASTDGGFFTGANQPIYALVQASTAAVDGDAVAASGGTENLQLSFVYYNSSDVLTATTITGTVEFDVNVVHSLYNLPINSFIGTQRSDTALTTANAPIKTAQFLVTTAIPGGSTFNLSAQTVGAGAATVTGDNTVKLDGGGDATATIADGFVKIFRNGTKQSFVVVNGTADVNWLSTTTFNFTDTLAVNELIEIESL